VVALGAPFLSMQPPAEARFSAFSQNFATPVLTGGSSATLGPGLPPRSAQLLAEIYSCTVPVRGLAARAKSMQSTCHRVEMSG
jgi:hypothetical protein